jgi:hypothetical protein
MQMITKKKLERRRKKAGEKDDEVVDVGRSAVAQSRAVTAPASAPAAVPVPAATKAKVNAPPPQKVAAPALSALAQNTLHASTGETKPLTPHPATIDAPRSRQAPAGGVGRAATPLARTNVTMNGGGEGVAFPTTTQPVGINGSNGKAVPQSE